MSFLQLPEMSGLKVIFAIQQEAITFPQCILLIKKVACICVSFLVKCERLLSRLNFFSFLFDLFIESS